MRAILGAMIILAAGCTQQSEKNSEVGATRTTETKTTTVSATMPSLDTAEAKRDVKEAGKKVENAVREAAHATGTAMEKAGKEIQKKTSKKP